MVLVTYQMQGSCSTFSSRSLLCCRGVKLKQHVATVCTVRISDRGLFLKHNVLQGVGASVHGLRVKAMKISAFKGNVRNDESRRRENGSASKNSAKLSYLPKESEESKTESPKVESVTTPYSSDSERKEGISGSPAIRILFRKWLNMLRTESPTSVDEIMEAGLPSGQELTETDETVENKNIGSLKSFLSHFLSLDATIKIPLLIFVPLYLAVKVLYGAEVSKDLTPLWILGPVIVAFYINMLRGLWALYVFSFRQMVKVMKNLPSYYLNTYNFIAEGKPKEYVRVHLLQPVVDFKNLDYKEVSKKNMRKLEEWVVDKYLDFVESIWPYYCQTIRFLKRANLI